MLAANEIKVDTNELVQILTCKMLIYNKNLFLCFVVSRDEILELDNPFGCGHSPLFTYPFFGEDQLLSLTVPAGTTESVLDSLEISLCLETSLTANSSKDVECFLGVSDEKILREARGKIEAILKDMAGACGFTVNFHHSWTEFQEIVRNNQEEISCAFEIAPGVVELLNFKGRGSFYNRIQLLLPFFIEAATPIDSRDPKWSIYLLTSSTSVNGLLTAYSYFKFPEGLRVRISQVLVFPRYQGNRLGTKLYRSVTQRLRQADHDCVEICVEDPTDGFERLRGLVDWQEAESAGIWKEEVSVKEALIKKMKLNEDHADRLINLNKCLQVPALPSNPKRSKTAQSDSGTALRQEIKRWLLKKYRKDLPEEKGERIGKLAELYEAELIEFIEPLIDLLKSQ